MSEYRRRRWLIDRKVQGALMFRVAGYWLYCLAAVTFTNCLWIVFTARPHSSGELFQALFQQCGPSLLGTLLWLPIVLMDCVRFSNRFVGPLLRLRREMARLAAEGTCQPVRFRDGDYWTDLGANFNEVLVRLVGIPAGEPTDDDNWGIIEDSGDEFAALAPLPVADK